MQLSDITIQEINKYDFGASFKEVFDKVGSQPGVTIDQYDDGTKYIFVVGEMTVKQYVFDKSEKLESVYILGTSAAISLIITGMRATQELVSINDKGEYIHVETGNKRETVMPHGFQDVWVIMITEH